jgi:hypothetical protein
MITQHWPNSKDRGAKPVPVLLCPPNIWHQLARQSSFLLQNYQVPTAQRKQFDSNTKAKQLMTLWNYQFLLGCYFGTHKYTGWKNEDSFHVLAGSQNRTKLSLSYAGIWYYMIHLLAAIGLTPGGSGTGHIYTKTIHRTTQITEEEEEAEV